MTYYTASGEPPGRWAGIGAARLGLTGVVDPGVIQRLYMQGIGPDGERLRRGVVRDEDDAAELAGQAYREAHPFAAETEVAEAVSVAMSKTGQVKVPYFDLTISAVKSVSVLHASLKVSAMMARKNGDDELADVLDGEADGIESDLIESARAAISRAERTACYARTGHHSSTTGEWRDGEGLVAALFVHHISRDGDPQLHVHAAIANMVRRADGEDGQWRALDGRALYQQRLSIAAYTDREMESRMIGRGYVMVDREDGNGAEVGGVSQDVMDLFSSRSRHLTPELAKLIDQYVRTHGKQPSKRTIWLLGQQAAQNTRRSKARARQRAGGKDTGEDLDETARLAAWEAQAAREESGVLSRVHQEVKGFTLAAEEPRPLDDDGRFRAARIAVAEVQKHHAVWSLAELAFEVNRALPAGARPEDISAVCRLAVSGMAGAEVIEVTAPDVVDARVLGMRKDGASIYRPPNEARYTTAGQLDLEDTIITLASRKVEPRVTHTEALAALEGTDLSAEQREAVAALLSTGQAVTILTAPAGAGKTHAVAAFSAAWMALTGKRVLGLATAENAARVMALEGVPEAYNTAAFLGKTKGSDLLRYPVPLHEGDVLILDESSQLSTTDLALILQAADRAGALVVPTGDMEQLGAVEAGGMVRMLSAHLGAVELTEVRRFTEEWEKDASLRLREGDKAVLSAYDTRGRIRGMDRERAYARATGAWLADFLRGKDTLLLAGSNAEASELARMVQQHLITLGSVQTPCAELADGNRAGTGDLVRARLNAHIDADGRRLTNRDTLKITGWKDGNAEARRLLPDGTWSASFMVPREYIANNTELAYAGNIHVAQGRTVDISHVLVTETLSRESLYVGLTRGREANFAWTVTGETAPEGKQPYQQAAPESVIAGIMERSSRELSAHEQIGQAQEWAGGTGHVLNLWSAATKGVTRQNIEEHLRNYLEPGEFARYLREPSRPVLNQALREREISGQDLRLLIASITSEPLTGARSVSSVLHGRLMQSQATVMTGTWEDRTPARAPEVAREAAAALDQRQRELGMRMLENPEPWLIAHLGNPPGPYDSPLLHEDYISKAGRAAAYREAAGIINPEQAVSATGHKESPELEAMRRDTILALEIRDQETLIRAASRGELEAKALDGYRAQAQAPGDVSHQLRMTAQAESDTRQQALDAELAGDEPTASGARELTDLLATQKTRLEAQSHEYQEWASRTEATRDIAEKAKTELQRRGHPEEKTESTLEWWQRFEHSLEAMDQALTAERGAAEKEGRPWPPEREPEIASAPDVSDLETSPESSEPGYQEPDIQAEAEAV
jgi:conjugative relaxase-like TrwC/TraI family protein